MDIERCATWIPTSKPIWTFPSLYGQLCLKNFFTRNKLAQKILFTGKRISWKEFFQTISRWICTENVRHHSPMAILNLTTTWVSTTLKNSGYLYVIQYSKQSFPLKKKLFTWLEIHQLSLVRMLLHKIGTSNVLCIRFHK